MSKAKRVLKNETIAVIGYGVQGPAQGLNMRDNGFNVIVGQAWLVNSPGVTARPGGVDRGGMADDFGLADDLGDVVGGGSADVRKGPPWTSQTAHSPEAGAACEVG